MTDQATRAQVDMLATTLAVEPERVHHLARLSPGALHDLRTGLSAAVFDDLAPTFARISKLAPIVPDTLIAALVPKIATPKVSGLVAGALGMDHPRRIRGVLSRIPPAYLAAAAPYLDPRVIPVLAPSLDPSVVIPAARELLRNRQYVTAAMFVEQADPSLIAAFESGLDDNEGLLRTAAMTPNTQRLNEILRQFPSERLRAIITDAADGTADLMLIGLSVLSRLASDLAQQLAEVFVESVDDDGLSRLVLAARDSAAIPELLTVVVSLTAASVDRIAGLPTTTEDATLESIARAVTDATRPGLDAISARLDDTSSRRLAQLTEAQTV